MQMVVTGADRAEAKHLVGQVFDLKTGGVNRVGRQPDNDVVLKDKYVSGYHAQIIVLDDGCTAHVTALGARNLTAVQIGDQLKQLNQGETKVLYPQMPVTFADITCELRMVQVSPINPAKPAAAPVPEYGGATLIGIEDDEEELFSFVKPNDAPAVAVAMAPSNADEPTQMEPTQIKDDEMELDRPVEKSTFVEGDSNVLADDDKLTESGEEEAATLIAPDYEEEAPTMPQTEPQGAGNVNIDNGDDDSDPPTICDEDDFAVPDAKSAPIMATVPLTAPRTEDLAESATVPLVAYEESPVPAKASPAVRPPKSPEVPKNPAAVDDYVLDLSDEELMSEVVVAKRPVMVAVPGRVVKEEEEPEPEPLVIETHSGRLFDDDADSEELMDEEKEAVDKIEKPTATDANLDEEMDFSSLDLSKEIKKSNLVASPKKEEEEEEEEEEELLESMTVPKLKEFLKSKDLSIKGKKSELLARAKGEGQEEDEEDEKEDEEEEEEPEVKGSHVSDSEDEKEIDFSSMTVVQLRSQLKDKGLTTAGTKINLIARLEGAVEGNVDEGKAEVEEKETSVEESEQEPVKRDLSALNVAQLRERLKSKGLTTAGTKINLIARIEGAEGADEEEEEKKDSDEEVQEEEEEKGDNGTKLSSLNVQQLKRKLKKRGLSLAGRKSDLVERLEGAGDGNSGAVAEEEEKEKEPAKKRSKMESRKSASSPAVAAEAEGSGDPMWYWAADGKMGRQDHWVIYSEEQNEAIENAFRASKSRATLPNGNGRYVDLNTRTQRVKGEPSKRRAVLRNLGALKDLSREMNELDKQKKDDEDEDEVIDDDDEQEEQVIVAPGKRGRSKKVTATPKSPEKGKKISKKMAMRDKSVVFETVPAIVVKKSKGKRSRVVKEAEEQVKSDSSSNDEIPASEPPLKRGTSSGLSIIIGHTGIRDEKLLRDIATLSKNLSLKLEEDRISQCTHLITAGRVLRTVKMLCSINLGVEVVDDAWVKECLRAKQVVDAKEWAIKDSAAEEKYDFSLAESLAKARQGKVFAGISFYCTAHTAPSPAQLTEIIQSGGGTVLTKLPSGKKSNKKVVIISCDEDSDEVCKLSARTGGPVYTTEFVLSACLRQKMDMAANILEAEF